MSAAAPLPGFKLICTSVGVTYVLLAGSMLVRGVHASMGPFAVPEQVLGSPHFADFFHWVFVHMTVLGALIAALGRFVTDGRSQLVIARLLCAIEAHYTYLDLRTSDSALGSGLYRGPASLVPVVVDVVVTLAFLYLSIGRREPALRGQPT